MRLFQTGGIYGFRSAFKQLPADLISERLRFGNVSPVWSAGRYRRTWRTVRMLSDKCRSRDGHKALFRDNPRQLDCRLAESAVAVEHHDYCRG